MTVVKFVTVSAVQTELPELVEDVEGISNRENESSESELAYVPHVVSDYHYH